MIAPKPGRALTLAAAGTSAVAVLCLREPAADLVLLVAEWVDSLGWIAPLAFTLVFAIALPAFIPAAPFLLSGGVLFGPLLGTLYGAIGNIAGGALAFVLARYLARQRVERALASNAGFAVMNRVLDREGARGVALIRLSPVLPAWLINYALGVSRINWKQYGLSAPAILPTTALYALAGAGLGDLAALERGGGLDRGAGYHALLGVGIGATVLASVLLGRRARKMLEELDDRDG
jgi:uncharacterized membrane protein YdjX (TVP38/TMEM64 family)